jgi:hypothetical protein
VKINAMIMSVEKFENSQAGGRKKLVNQMHDDDERVDETKNPIRLP